MKRKNLTLSIVTAAALAAFGAVNAHDVDTDPSVSVDPTLTMPSESSISSSTSSSSPESMSSLPSDSSPSPSASVDSITDEERLNAQGGAEQVAGAFEEYAPETGSAEERQRN